MDINNMKVTDLKKELKARGLSIVGNKAELMARLAPHLQTNQTLSITNDDSLGDNNEAELLGEDIANESLSKADDHLIDNLLNTKTTVTSPKKVAIVETKPMALLASTIPTAPSDTTDPKPTLLKTTNTIKLSSNESKALRAQKFGDNKMTERAKRFGVNTSTTDSTQSKTPKNSESGIVDEKLKVRAQRFGSVVSEKMKKIEDNEKLLKRKERFTGTTSSNTNPSVTSGPLLKRKISSSLAPNEDRKQQRLARFGTVS